MSRTSKSPKDVLQCAWEVAQGSLPAHRHKFSPKKFTQHQLFACLVLKNFLKTDYRGLTRFLSDCPTLTEAIELSVVSIIPAKHGRPTTKPAKGKYRRLMQTHFNVVRYRQRAQVETVMSMIKRRQGSHCKG